MLLLFGYEIGDGPNNFGNMFGIFSSEYTFYERGCEQRAAGGYAGHPRQRPLLRLHRSVLIRPA